MPHSAVGPGSAHPGKARNSYEEQGIKLGTEKSKGAVTGLLSATYSSTPPSNHFKIFAMKEPLSPHLHFMEITLPAPREGIKALGFFLACKSTDSLWQKVCSTLGIPIRRLDSPFCFCREALPFSLPLTVRGWGADILQVHDDSSMSASPWSPASLWTETRAAKGKKPYSSTGFNCPARHSLARRAMVVGGVHPVPHSLLPVQGEGRKQPLCAVTLSAGLSLGSTCSSRS